MKCSVRCAFRLSRKQEGAIECVAQFQSSKGVTSEVCDGDDIREGGSVLYKMSGSSESDIYNSICESEVRGTLEEYVGGDARICNSNFCGRELFGLVRFIRHDGISRYSSMLRMAGFLSGLRATHELS
jgi:hypothetical protein